MNSLPGYTQLDFAFDGMTHAVYQRGTGPSVLIMHELPGMVPECVALADEIADARFTVFLPLLFGEANQPSSRLRTLGYFTRICISREFRCFSANESSPITTWLRALCVQKIQPASNGRGIGAIGMCLTGGFVLCLMISDLMLAPVICQPGLPFGSTAAQRAALGVSTVDFQQAVDSKLPLLGYRFKDDRICRQERFDTLERAFGPQRFERHDLPGDKHSVLTLDYVGDPAHPTFQARKRMIEFLKQRLT